VVRIPGRSELRGCQRPVLAGSEVSGGAGDNPERDLTFSGLSKGSIVEEYLQSDRYCDGWRDHAGESTSGDHSRLRTRLRLMCLIVKRGGGERNGSRCHSVCVIPPCRTV
jgi:hypothetical protein